MDTSATINTSRTSKEERKNCFIVGILIQLISMFKRILGGLRERKKARHDAFSKSPIRLILGIGNPGEQHQNTYHNAGLLYLDYLSGGCKNEFKQYRSFAFC